jgi:hypothetical protein
MTGRNVRAWADRHLSRKRLTVLGTLLVLVLGGALFARNADIDAVITAVVEADLALLGAALVAYLISWPVRGRRYRDVLGAMECHCRTRFLTAIIFASQTANLVVPARAGDGIRAYLLNDQRDVPYPTGVASLAVERAFDLVALATLGGVAFAFLLLDGRSISSAESVGSIEPMTAVTGAAVIAVIAVLLSAVTLAAASSDRQFGPVLRDRVQHPRMVKVVDALIRFGAAVRVVAADPRSLGTVYLWSTVVWALDVLTAVFVLAALVGGPDGGLVSPVILLTVGTLAVTVGNLAKVLPLSQGGIGLYEAAFTGLVVSTTVIPVETALAVAILDHALKNAVTLGGGGLAAVAFNISPTHSPEDTEASTTESPDF